MISGGAVKDIRWDNGNWLIFDIGFSQKQKSCAFLINDRKPHVCQFSEAIMEIENF